MLDFDYYIQQGEPSQREKAEAWAVAIGLQDVDGLKPSDYLIDTARKHIEGDVDYEEAKRLVESYYETLPLSMQNEDEEEADKVSLHVTQLLSENTFTFSPAGLANIHRRLFVGVLPFAGRYRDVNITKKEWVLDGDTVLYASCDAISETLAYDFEQERTFSYKHVAPDRMIEHIARFIAGVWQIHPFREGNTRTTAIFLIKYLRKLGFQITNQPFADYVKYFRNALVRANYSNYEKKIEETTEFLELFLRNVLLGEQNELKKRYQHIRWQHPMHNVIGYTPSSTPSSLWLTQAVERLILALGEEKLSKKELMEKLQLKDRSNFEDYSLTPTVKAGMVKLLYPAAPKHPRQKYLLTEKGLQVYMHLRTGKQQ